jgi:ABC-type multidrug transport system fused ATPase/permease subunit
MINIKNKFLILGIVVAFFLWFFEVILHVVVFKTGNFTEEIFPLKNPDELWMRFVIVVIVLLFGYISQRMANKITNAYKKEREITEKLEGSLQEIKVLRGILPICASCKKIRDDHGYWRQIENYIRKHSEAEFSHSLCPVCEKRLYPELADTKPK